MLLSACLSTVIRLCFFLSSFVSVHNSFVCVYVCMWLLYFVSCCCAALLTVSRWVEQGQLEASDPANQLKPQ